MAELPECNFELFDGMHLLSSGRHRRNTVQCLYMYEEPKSSIYSIQQHSYNNPIINGMPLKYDEVQYQKY